MIHNLIEVFSSTIKSLEMLYLIHDKKFVVRNIAHEKDIKKIAGFLKKNNLNYSLSDFKIKKISNNSPYSDSSIKIDKNSQYEGYFFFYISKKQELADRAKAYEQFGMHFELGIILGYPKCCVDFFSQNFNKDNTDLTLNTLNNTQSSEFPFYTNIASRHFDISLISHFPCKFTCNNSILIAKENLETISKISKQFAEVISNSMKKTFLYTQSKGVFILNGCSKNSEEITFNTVTPTIKNLFYYLLEKTKKINIIEKNKIIINNQLENASVLEFK